MKEPPAHKRSRERRGTLTARRKRGRHLHVMVTEDELAQIQRRMAEAGITNAGAYMRKMALNGYILHVDLAPVKELVSLQRRCANNLNQVAVHANTFGVYPEEIAGLQRDYEKLWGRVSDVLTELVCAGGKITLRGAGLYGLRPAFFSFRRLRAKLARGAPGQDLLTVCNIVAPAPAW